MFRRLQHYAGGEIAPAPDELLAAEEDHQGYCHTSDGYAFSQECGARVIAIGLRDTGHAYSQAGVIKKLLEILLGSCSARGAAASAAFLANIRPCCWALVLKAQAGDCKIDQIGDIITAKTLWLSQRPRPDLQLATGFHCAWEAGALPESQSLALC